MRLSLALAALMLHGAAPSNRGIPDDARPTLQRCYPVDGAPQPFAAIGSNQAPLD